MNFSRHTASVLVLTLALAATTASPAQAHRERDVVFPDGSGSVPAYRSAGPYLVVCNHDTPARAASQPKALRKRIDRLYAECRRDGFENLQDAVDAVTTQGTRILLLPGIYREPPSRAPLSPECQALDDPHLLLTYEQQLACPHAQNLVAILGDGSDDGIGCDGRLCDLQIEGVAAGPEDVVIDGGYTRHVVIRADRADGVYFHNFTVQHAPDFALYVMETDGFVIDRMVGRWNDAYAFLTFADDHGKYVDCEAYGNGDSGLYPGAASPQFGSRASIEITGCNSHHNFAGLGGTAGNSLYVHDNDFHHNTVGIALDSVFPRHPGMPQGWSRIIGNRIYSNNQDYYRYYRDGTCSKPSQERGADSGVVCPTTVGPIGTGVLLAGGNHNEFRDNWVWDNHRYGFMQLWVPAYLRGEQDPTKVFDTSHANAYTGNLLGTGPAGQASANGVDFWWDEEGTGNCWQGNTAITGAPTSDPAVVPDCSAPAVFTPPNLAKSLALLSCLQWSPTNLDPQGCEWTMPPNTEAIR